MNQNPESPLLEMPDVTNLTYIIEYLLELGTSLASGFGVTPITWTELRSWLELSELQLDSWESNLLISLSRSFCANYTKFDEKDFPTPYVIEEFDRKAASASIGGSLRLLAKRMNKK